MRGKCGGEKGAVVGLGGEDGDVDGRGWRLLRHFVLISLI